MANLFRCCRLDRTESQEILILSVTANLPSALGKIYRIDWVQKSQNHRMLGVRRDLCGSSSPTLLPKQGHLQQAAVGFFLAGVCTFGHDHRRRPHPLLALALGVGTPTFLMPSAAPGSLFPDRPCQPSRELVGRSPAPDEGSAGLQAMAFISPSAASNLIQYILGIYLPFADPHHNDDSQDTSLIPTY